MTTAFASKPSARRDSSAKSVYQAAFRTLVGYHCRRAYLAVLDHASGPMAGSGLRRTSFSALVLLHHNPGATSRMLCDVLGMHPPNLVGLVASFEERGLVERARSPDDARASGLYLTAAGRRVATRVERAVAQAELRATAMLSDVERETLNRLLVRIRTAAKTGSDADRNSPTTGRSLRAPPQPKLRSIR